LANPDPALGYFNGELRMVGGGSLMRTKATANATLVYSDELLSAFLELEATLL
jgi:hypothetical protein